ncbi:hypothetical protein ACFQ1L_23270 [Phytohabitans flavus]|uniref:hypothetical protein n=1 Tax=Phytohabitans flavus TaxID=1076124 RepID=UPI003635DACE
MEANIGDDQVTEQWNDLDGDGIIDTQLVDVDGDGQTDLQYTDTNVDGAPDLMMTDYDADGVADVQAFRDSAGVDHVAVDVDSDGLADQVFSSGPFPVEVSAPVGTGDAPIFDVPATTLPDAGPSATTYGLTGDTAAIADSVNASMADAGTIYDSVVDPGSVSDAEVDAAMERADNAAQNSRLLEGDIYQREVSNDIYQGNLDRQYSEEASRIETDTYIETENAVSRAEDAVWQSEQARS